MSAEGREWAWALPKGLTAGARLVALALGDRWQGADMRMSHAALLARTTLSNDGVIGGIAALEAAGHITVDRGATGSRQVNTFHLVTTPESRVVTTPESRVVTTPESRVVTDSHDSGEQNRTTPESRDVRLRRAESLPKEHQKKTHTRGDELRPRRSDRERVCVSVSDWSPAAMMQKLARRYATDNGAENIGAYASTMVKRWRAPTGTDEPNVWEALQRWHYAGISDSDAAASAWAMIQPAPPPASVIVERPRHDPQCTNCPGDGYVTQYDARGVAFVVECQNGA